MKKNNINLTITAVVVSLALGLTGPMAAFAAGPAVVNLGSAGNFVILAKTGISTTGPTSIVGDIGVSPAAASYITGFGLMLDSSSAFSTSALVTGKVYSADYAVPAPTTMTTAVSDMETAYTDATGRTNPTETEMGAGNIGGTTLVPGLYKWGTDVTIPTDITLSGGPNDVWIFQIGGNLVMSSATHIILSGGAQASNVFWAVAGQTTIGTSAVFNGNILDQTTIVLNTGAVLNGRALAQAAVTLDANTVTAPVLAAVVVSVTPTTTTTTAPTSISPIACPMVALYCPYGGHTVLGSDGCSQTICDSTPTATSMSISANVPIATSSPVAQAPTTSNNNTALQAQLNGLLATLQSLQTQATQQNSSVSTSVSGQPVKSIAIDLGEGSGGSDVTTLQQFLISQNKGPAAAALANVGATGYYGALTYAAMAEFQTSVGITSSALGDFGPITRAYISAHY